MNTVMQRECAYCGEGMGEIEGHGQTGKTHGICPRCVKIERLKMAQDLVKTQHLSWAEALKKCQLPDEVVITISRDEVVDYLKELVGEDRPELADKIMEAAYNLFAGPDLDHHSILREARYAAEGVYIGRIPREATSPRADSEKEPK